MMKTAITMTVMLALAALTGCQSNSPRGGSVQEGKGFNLAAPAFATEIKQGQTQSVDITLVRGDYFKQDVKLQITAPDGLAIDPDRVTIKASDKPDMQLRITAADKAALGEYRVAIKGTPHSGESTTTVFIVKVSAP